MRLRYTRWIAGLALVAGCQFDPSGFTGGAAVVDGAAPVDASARDASSPPCPRDDDLVACYRFEGDAADDTANLNHGVAGNVTFEPGRPGRGTAIAFSPNASVVAPDSPSLDVTTGITVEAWLRLTSLPMPNNRMAVLDNNGQYGIFLSPIGEIRCSIGSTTAIGLAVVVGTWTHVACTYDGTTIRMYQDAVAGPTAASTGNVPTAGIDGLGLGQNLPVPPADHLDGLLDDVRIWRVALLPGAVCTSSGLCP